jgi:hypothetical protein
VEGHGGTFFLKQVWHVHIVKLLPTTVLEPEVLSLNSRLLISEKPIVKRLQEPNSLELSHILNAELFKLIKSTIGNLVCSIPCLGIDWYLAALFLGVSVGKSNLVFI